MTKKISFWIMLQQKNCTCLLEVYYNSPKFLPRKLALLYLKVKLAFIPMTHLNSSFIPSSGGEANLRWHPWLKTVSLKRNQKSPFFLLTKCLTSSIFACWLHFEKLYDNISVITQFSHFQNTICRRTPRQKPSLPACTAQPAAAAAAAL